jgi:hypothetical protein
VIEVMRKEEAWIDHNCSAPTPINRAQPSSSSGSREELQCCSLQQLPLVWAWA